MRKTRRVKTQGFLYEPRPIEQLHEGKVMREFPTMTSATHYGFSLSGLSKACNGELKTYKGFRWRFKE